MATGKAEQRFREGSGNKYLADGQTRRCQALSIAKINRWRKDHNDQETPIDELWPECQCTQPAVPGGFVCRWHGGMAIIKSKPEVITDVLPFDLREKFEALSKDNGRYLSRYDDIVLIEARVWQLLEELSEISGSSESWGRVEEALLQLKRGNGDIAEMLLEKATQDTNRVPQIWDEIRKNESLLKELTTTQVATMRTLQTMATAEQVNALVSNLLQVILTASEKFFRDEPTRVSFLSYIHQQFSRFVATPSVATVIDQPSDNN